MKVQITDRAKEILLAGTIAGNLYTLPPGQLDRPLYEEVNKVLAAGGGKWNRAAKGHLFPSAERLEALRAQWTAGDEVVNVKKATQAFYTPPELASDLVAWCELFEGARVLEPSAGEGALVDEVNRREFCRITVCEIDPVSADRLKQKLDPATDTLNVCDFLDADHFGNFDRIVMNPPFTKGQDIKHVRHAWRFLAPGGILCAIMSPGWRTGTQKAQAAFREFVEEHGEVKDIEAGAFAQSGTQIATVRIKLRKPEAKPKAKKQAEAKHHELREKLRRLAEQGVNGERENAKAKLEHLESAMDFSAQVEKTADIFAGEFLPASNAVTIATVSEMDVANAIKWSFESAAGIECLFCGHEIRAKAAPTTARRLGSIAEVIRKSFLALWEQYSQAGAHPLDWQNFVLGLYDGMMREERTGEALPKRWGAVKAKRAKKNAVVLPGMARHPYSVAVELGRKIRFDIPLADITAELDRTMKGEICDAN